MTFWPCKDLRFGTIGCCLGGSWGCEVWGVMDGAMNGDRRELTGQRRLMQIEGVRGFMGWKHDNTIHSSQIHTHHSSSAVAMWCRTWGGV